MLQATKSVLRVLSVNHGYQVGDWVNVVFGFKTTNDGVILSVKSNRPITYGALRFEKRGSDMVWVNPANNSTVSWGTFDLTSPTVATLSHVALMLDEQPKNTTDSPRTCQNYLMVIHSMAVLATANMNEFHYVEITSLVSKLGIMAAKIRQLEGEIKTLKAAPAPQITILPPTAPPAANGDENTRKRKFVPTEMPPAAKKQATLPPNKRHRPDKQ